MVAKEPFTLVYAPVTSQHLRAIDRKHYSLIRAKIEEQLFFEPTTETRNRKPLKRPAFETATWELRFGPDNRFRVYYEVLTDVRQVQILAIAVIVGNQVFLGGEEVQL